MSAIVTTHRVGMRPVWGGGRINHTFAALDLGTNNCRLLIARPNGDSFRVIDAFSRIVRLGEGLMTSGRLSEEAMTRTVEALRICAGKIRRRGVTHARSVATEACRRAGNCNGFVERVKAETGIDIEIISTREEARLAFTGCAPLLDGGYPRALVFDIGGGSTELGWLDLKPGRSPELLAWLSIPIGVVTLTERYGGSLLPPGSYESMVEDVLERLRPFEAANGIAAHVAAGAVQMLGTSGTVTTLAGVHIGLPRYDRAVIDGCFLDFEAIRSVSRALAAMDFDGRAKNPCVGRERADLVVSGCAILEAICQLWPVGRLRVADRGVREGILLGLMVAERGRRRRTPGFRHP
ncbi:Ppx/GppA phosphatase family protein [Virgifigura deserti]|uniref:Ppx/GppA phosphatase family protein n=1 Tax=Virgifigura deserti TaxID=2268457 RepID=UPI003CCC264C